jgi:hypothetical protein
MEKIKDGYKQSEAGNVISNEDLGIIIDFKSSAKSLPEKL